MRGDRVAISVFKRYEKKFMLTTEQYLKMREFLADYMDYDKYCLNDNVYCLYNIYLDSPNNDLIRRSVEKPVYKEKLRIRSYYPVREKDDKVFFEIKQKHEGVVTKRRAVMTYGDTMEMIRTKKLPENTPKKYIDAQVQKEILRMLVDYDLSPAVFLSYHRIAMFGKEDPELRITFDTEIRARRTDVSFDKELYAEPLLEEGKILMEIKIPLVMPMWLARYLSENKIFSSSFSKYGKEYERFVLSGKQNLEDILL